MWRLVMSAVVRPVMEQSVEELVGAIERHDARVAIVGLGYVGLPVAVEFAEAGFDVIGIDLDDVKVASLNAGESYLVDVPSERIAPLVGSGRLQGSTGFVDASDADAILICVPTPISDGTPDLSRVVAATASVAQVLKRGALVVLESTTYPGSTDELVKPLLEEGGRVGGTDFFLAFSPERIDPGNPVYGFGDIPKIVGGIDDASGRLAAALYGQVVPKVITVSGTKEAELAKLIENTFRHVNIALVNELAVYAHEMGIDIWEAIDAAATKPFGFMPFYPGPGWGGHCIPLDPAYLSWRVRRDRAHEVRFVEVAQAVNSEMPRFVAERISHLLNDEGKSVRNAKILAIGVSYKPGIDDTREAGSLKVLARLLKQGAQVSYYDPLVTSVEIRDQELASVPLDRDLLAAQDLVVILVRQTGVDWTFVTENATLIFDCCNALGQRGPRIHRL
ncbi:MAG: nucleotide sugar dehydrogenase [Actinomycetota bacterium]|nr:nucleotide sugar dehydrogenase [Actinomycetota bacterium]